MLFGVVWVSGFLVLYGMCNQEEHLVGVLLLLKSDYCMTQLGGLAMMKHASGHTRLLE